MGAAVITGRQARSGTLHSAGLTQTPILVLRGKPWFLFQEKDISNGEPSEKKSYSQAPSPLLALLPSLAVGELGMLRAKADPPGGMSLLPSRLGPYSQSPASSEAQVAGPHPARGPAAAPGPGPGWARPPPATESS